MYSRQYAHCLLCRNRDKHVKRQTVADLPWVIGAVLGVNVEFFTLGKHNKEDKLVNTFM